MSPRKNGRPPKNGVARSEVVSVKLTPAEKRKLEKAAFLAGESMGEFIRRALEEKHERILKEKIRKKTWNGYRKTLDEEVRKWDGTDGCRGF